MTTDLGRRIITQRSTLLAGAVAALGLAGCGSKPPGCADPQTLTTIKELLIEKATPHLLDGVTDDPNGMARRFAQELKVEVSGIVSEGYSSEKKKQACKATMKVTHVWGEVFERPIEYSTQLTEDQKGGFILEVQDLQMFARGVGVLSQQHYRQAAQKNLVGSYTGEGDGKLRVEIKAGTAGAFNISLATTSDNCGGAVSGTATANAEGLAFTGKDGDQVCVATLRMEGGKLIVDEGSGCMYFHGAACGFSGELTKTR